MLLYLYLLGDIDSVPARPCMYHLIEIRSATHTESQANCDDTLASSRVVTKLQSSPGEGPKAGPISDGVIRSTDLQELYSRISVIDSTCCDSLVTDPAP